MLKTYQYKGDIHSSKTANVILPGVVTEYRWTPLRVQNRILVQMHPVDAGWNNSCHRVWLLLRLYTFNCCSVLKWSCSSVAVVCHVLDSGLFFTVTYMNYSQHLEWHPAIIAPAFQKIFFVWAYQLGGAMHNVFISCSCAVRYYYK